MESTADFCLNWDRVVIDNDNLRYKLFLEYSRAIDDGEIVTTDEVIDKSIFIRSSFEKLFEIFDSSHSNLWGRELFSAIVCVSLNNFLSADRFHVYSTEIKNELSNLANIITLANSKINSKTKVLLSELEKKCLTEEERRLELNSELRNLFGDMKWLELLTVKGNWSINIRLSLDAIFNVNFNKVIISLEKKFNTTNIYFYV